MSMRRTTVASILILVALLFVGVGGYALRAHSLSIVEKCKSAVYKNSCYSSTINAALKAKGLNAAFNALADAYNADPGYLATCHADTHDLGKEAYKEFHTTGKVELSSKTTYCGYGFYHGFMEELIFETDNFDEARAFCTYVGQTVPNPRGYAEGACYHGIGHGVTDGTDPRLWGSAQRLAAPGLALCLHVAEGERDHQYRCDSGVFNAVALLYQDPKYRLEIHADPFALCSTASFDSVEKASCFSQMNTLAQFAANYDFAKAMSFAQHMSFTQYRELAIGGVAATYFSNARSRHKPVSPKDVSDICSVRSTDAEACIIGVVSGIQEFGTPGAEYTDALSLCQSPDLHSSLAPACYRALLSATQQFYGDTVMQRVCRLVPERYRTDSCTI